MSVLENTYKRCGSFLSKCANTFVSLLKIAIRSKFGATLPAATENTCIVLGNGPSLKDSLIKHPDFFKKHPLVCVNAFSLSGTYTELKPEYYVILDPNFWLTETDFVKNTLSAITQKTNWKLTLLLPQQAKKSALIRELCMTNTNVNVCYYNYTVFKGFQAVANRLYRKNLAMPQSQNVLVASVFLSINIGFKEIYIVGADHTWHQALHVDENNRLCIKDVHFYDDDKTQITYKPFRIALDSEETHRMDEIFTIWSRAFYGYIALKKYADYRKATVYNASEVSFIDAFKRVKL